MLVSVFINTSYSGPFSPEIDSIFNELEQILKEYKFDNELAKENNSFKATYHTDKFIIHSIDKTGYISPKTVEVIGPNHDGFILASSIKECDHRGAALIPQELDRTYWKTFINAYPLSASNQYIWFSLIWSKN